MPELVTTPIHVFDVGARDAAFSRAADRARVSFNDMVGHELDNLAPVRTDTSGPSASPTVEAAFANAKRVDAFVRQTIEPNGLPGPLTLLVHAASSSGHAPFDNAAWSPEQQNLRFGDGIAANGTRVSYAGNVDVVAHELGHALFEHAVRGARAGKVRMSGAMRAFDESWADLVAVAMHGDAGDWTIHRPGGGRGIRDLRAPAVNDARLLPDYLPNPSDLVGATGLHYSKIARIGLDAHNVGTLPSYVAMQVGTKVGRQSMLQIWYRALHTLTPTSSLTDAARATRESAAAIFGTNSPEAQAVTDAWTAVHLGEKPTLAHRIARFFKYGRAAGVTRN